MVESYVASVNILSDMAAEGKLTLKHCIAIDNVCHDREVYNTDFFFMYA